MSNQNINRNPGIKWAIFNFKRAKGMDCFDYLNSLYYFTFLLQWICKKLCGVCTLTAESSLLPMRASVLLAGTPFPRSSICTLWMTPWDNFSRKFCVRHCVRKLCVRECLDIMHSKGKLEIRACHFWTNNSPIAPKIFFSEKPSI